MLSLKSRVFPNHLMRQENKENNNKNAENISNRLKLEKKKKKGRCYVSAYAPTCVCVCSQTADVCHSHCRACWLNPTTESTPFRNSPNGLSLFFVWGLELLVLKTHWMLWGSSASNFKGFAFYFFLMPLKVWDCGVCCFTANHRGIGLHVSSFVFKAAVYVCVLW